MPAHRTKILVLRQPMKSVRPEDERRPIPLGLVVGSLATVGAVGVVWLLGYIGYRLGFADVLGVPELLTESGGGLLTGALITMQFPLRVFEVSVAEPLWLMMAFLLVAIPAGGLVGARRLSRGGPKPSTLFTTMSWTGAIAAALFGGLALAYVVAPFRAAWMRPLPEDLGMMEAWLNGLSVVAGLDGLMVIAAVLWAVLSMRVECPPWMRGISAGAAIFALGVTSFAMAISNAAVAQLHRQRSVAIIGGVDSPQVLVGYTRRHAVVMHTDANRPVIEFFDVPTQFWVTERKSIADLLLE